MNWMVYAAGAALALAVADILVKLASGKMPTSLGLLYYGCVPFAAGVIWVIIDKARGVPMTTTPIGLTYALGVGVAFTLVTIALYAAFAAGAPISTASPLIRVGGLIVASIVGVLFWREAITARYVLGIVLSLAGIFLIIKS